MPRSIPYTPALQKEYQDLFDTCVIRPEKAGDVESLIGKISENKARYAAVGGPLGIPWFFIGVIHCMEASLNFNTHLHNGDPLTARTVQVPRGRPTTGAPPFTWEESATDALVFEELNEDPDWSMPRILYKLEAYNGFGYRRGHPEVLTPYLWSFSNHYTKGKFVKDGVFSPTAVSKQCGAAVLLRRMAETGVILFKPDGMPVTEIGTDTAEGDSLFAQFGPLVKFAPKTQSPLAEELQRALNRFPGIFVKPDGFAGERTSDAFKKVTGHFLTGDPRA